MDESDKHQKITYASLLGAVVAEEREFRKLSQAEAAVAADTTQSTWARLELGRACTLENILKASNLFGFEPWQLFKVIDDRVQSLKEQGYVIAQELPPEDELREDRASWITSRNEVTTASLIALTAVTGIAAMSHKGVSSYIQRLFGTDNK